jgi:hypothetical protein
MPAEAPPAPAAAPAAPAAPAAAPRIEIPASSLVAPPTGQRPAPPKGSAREKLQQNLQKKFGDDDARPGSTAKPEAGPTEPDPDAPPEAGGDPDATPPPASPDPQPPAAGDKGKQPKQSPWKLVEELKTTRLRLEKENQELRSQITPETDRKQINEKLTNIEKRNAELEEEIRFVKFEKSKEFADVYQAPYEKAWMRATKELSEITVTGEDGQPRMATTQDLLTIVQMPLGQARAVANQVFGDFANDMMNHRQAIRDLAEKQQGALEEARKNGSAREQERAQAMVRQHEEVSNWVKKTWEAETQAVLSNEQIAPFFKPREGDVEWNKRLDEGFKFVDDTYALPNVQDPRLTPDQRAAIVRKHAAVRNRAAGWRALRFEVTRVKGELEKAKAELAKYKGTTPGAEGRGAIPPAVGGAKGMDGMRSRLEKLARPA